jgi:hypothetical protein
MAEAALIVLVFIAGIAFNHFWPRFVKWAESKPKPDGLKVTAPNGNIDVGQFTGIRSPRTVYPGKLSVQEADIAPSPKPIDKRRRGVAEMRHIAEQESLKTERHQDEVTAKNIKAMQ